MTVDKAALRELLEKARIHKLYIRTNRHTDTDGKKWGWTSTEPPGGQNTSLDLHWTQGEYTEARAQLMVRAINSLPALLAENEALSAELQARQWRPIATAPKDGSPIIIACIADGIVYDLCNGHFEIVAEDEEDGPWDIRDGEPWCSYEGRAAGEYFCCWLPGKEWESRWRVTDSPEYTHWMPLPLPPAPPQGDGA